MELGIDGYSDPNLRRIIAVESNALHPADLHAGINGEAGVLRGQVVRNFPVTS
jgi:hypothetical protein